MVSLRFNPEASYTGSYEINEIKYDCYRTTYCTKPIIGQNWMGIPSEEFFKLNIKVPKNMTEEEKKKAPILFYNPWGGDFGQPAAKPESLNNPMKEAVMRAGWILVEPGMRGNNCIAGEPGKTDFYDYAKLPRPLADLKAAIRYLRYQDNAETIPGDKDRIWIAGVSSGGCASSIIGTSGDSPLFDPYLEEIGAADASDAVYGSAPSCPVMNRANGDPALIWERWDSLEEDANEYNKLLYNYYPGYFNSLGLKAEVDVPAAGVKKGDLLTDANLKDYIYEYYVKNAALKFLNKLGSREKIEEYLAAEKSGDPMYASDASTREWIRPFYDETGKVIDIEGTYSQFWKYTVGASYYDQKNEVNWQFEKPISAPDEMFCENGTLNEKAGLPFVHGYGCLSSYSFGKPQDYLAVFSELGQKYIMEKRQMTISPDYLELIAMQRNSVNPMYFILDAAGQSKIAERWFIRTGSVDMVTPHPNFIGLGTALMNAGKDVDIAFVWDERHGLTSEIKEFMAFTGE